MTRQIKSLSDAKEALKEILDHMGYIVVGQELVVKQVLIAILCNANAILEGYPGMAKTLMVKAMSQLLDLKFSRVQGTPDLMPSDILGTYVLEEENGKRKFNFQKGPIFSNIVLMDEINRATPKTQSALLEAMQEKQVTIGNDSFQMDKPFFVLATSNPIEQEGTYPLPEAQRDRFLFKILTNYPDHDEELEILGRIIEEERKTENMKPILDADGIKKLQRLVQKVPVADDIKAYVVKIIQKTRNHKELIEFGASPRASIGLLMASKAHALLDGRTYVTKDDVNAMVYPVLRHRLILNFEAERNNFNEDDVIKYMIK